MKSVQITLLLGVFIAARDVRAEPPETTLPDKPVARWAFDESNGAIAADQVGSIKGNYVGVASRRGVRGLAANFAGQAASRIQILLNEQQDAHVEQVLNGSFSLEVWLLDEAAAPNGKTNYSLFYKADSQAFTRNSLWLYRARQDGRYHFRIHDSRDRKIQLIVPNPAGKKAGDGKWHHIAVVINRDQDKRQALAYR